MKSSFCTVALLALLSAGAYPSAAKSDDTPYWPSEQQDRLSEVDDSILKIIDERRKARFDHDAAKLKELDDKMKKLSDEKVELLQRMKLLQ